MWARNLLFLGVVLAAAGLLRQSVFAPRQPKPVAWSDSSERQDIVTKVDRAFEASWDKQNLVPTERADELTVVRRLALGLTGSLPSLEEIRQIEQEPAGTRADFYLALLLADRRTADFLAERMARATVGADEGPFFLFRRRRFATWLADQFAEKRPYDQVVRSMVADSGLWTDKPQTNFITAHIKPDSDEDPDPAKLAARVSRAFLGQRIDCAECHDHPFAHWKQRDFQQLAAFFSQTKRSFTGIRDGEGKYEVEDHNSGKKVFVDARPPFQPELAPAEGSLRERLATWLTDPHNKAFSRITVNRAWAILFGRALVEPIDDIPDEVPPVLDLLAQDFADHGFDYDRLIRTIASTRAFRIDSRGVSETQPTTVAQAQAFAAFPISRLRPEQVVGAVQQASSLETLDYQSHIFSRVLKVIGQSDFINAYGDNGSAEFETRGGTIPQRLLMMNGEIVSKKTDDNIFANASTRIAALTADNERAIETAYLCVLTRRPTEIERDYFLSRIDESRGADRKQAIEDLFWNMFNATEFAWNH